MFNFSKTSIFIGLFIIIFIISVSLLIFAPKSKNYYDASTYPFIQYINENNNQLIKDEFYKIKNNDKWLKYPDKKNTKGDCEIWPLYVFSTESKYRISMNSELYKIITNTPDIKSCLFIKFHPKSEIIKSKLWKELANNTLRCLIIIDAPNDINNCAIWVNGEIKKLKNNDLIIFDSSKEYSIYNKTKYPLHILVIDIKRPNSIPIGTSDIKYNDEIYTLINTLNEENIKNNTIVVK
jgi:hypothetical protein